MVLPMRFSEEEVYLLGMALALVVSPFVGIPYLKMFLKRYWSDKRGNSLNDMAVLALFILLFVCAFYFYALRPFFHYTSVSWLFIIGSCLEIMFLSFYLKPFNRYLIEENRHSLSDEEVAASVLKRDIPFYTQLVCILLLNSALSLGCIGFGRWFMPDVVEVRNGAKRAVYQYKVSDYFTFPFERGMRPGGSYIDNLSKDTIYRVIVNYGYPGEDRYNNYTVQGKYSPHSFCMMPSRTLHVMDTIAPIMPPSHGRMGRYHTQMVYLTDYEHLWDFRLVKMRQFGIERNRWVDSIKESRNLPIYENYEEYRAYKRINPYPYSRLIPDSLIRRKRKNRDLTTQ